MNSGRIKTLISAAELVQIVGDQDMRLFDCRLSLQNPVAGLQAYERGHIEGAMFADMCIDLSQPHVAGETGRHPLPDKDQWIDKVLNWGLSPEVKVVVYDDRSGAAASRLWWMLKWIGHENVQVLDGGLQAWESVGGELVRTVPQPYERREDRYSSLESITRLVDANEIINDEFVLLDAREQERFDGKVEPLDPVAGHIPEAICCPFQSNLKEDGTFTDVATLQKKFAVVANTFLPVACYCGSGVTACHNILAIVHAGLPMPALYAGSWSDWITDPQRPVVSTAS